jgi:hypothetical protein
MSNYKPRGLSRDPAVDDSHSNLSHAERAQEFNRDRERQLRTGERDATTYHAMANRDEETELGGRFVQGNYPRQPETSPWGDRTAEFLNRAPDQLGYRVDAMEPISPRPVPPPPPDLPAIEAAVEAVAKAGKLPTLHNVLAELSDAALAHEFARVSREQMQVFESGPELDRLEARRLEIEAEIERRRRG